MPITDLEITQKAIYVVSKRRKVHKDIFKMKKEYLYLKNFLIIAAMNLTDIDEIKE